MINTDTIVALATPFAVGAIGVVRISGDKTFDIIDTIFVFRNKKKNINNIDSHTVHLGDLVYKGITIDEVLITIFKNPNSYTGEDLVEISCHGSLYIQKEIINVLIQSGARAAEAGEFTMRAFLNGKMDLSQTEAVADLIHSQSEASKNIAIKQLRGGFSNDLKVIREQLIYFASLIELELDFSEEDVEFADRSNLIETIEKDIRFIQKLSNTFKIGNAIKNGISVAIVGKPNAGKSTLLNSLLNEDRAIVTEIAGTTRDTLEEVMQINGIEFRFIDTAGIRETDDIIEKIGVTKALQKLENSDIYIYLFDIITTDIELLQNELDELPLDIPRLLVANKIDKAEVKIIEEFSKTFNNLIFVSAKNKEDIEKIKDSLLQKLDLYHIESNANIVSNARHFQELNATQMALEDVLFALKNNVTGDLIAIDIRQALMHLGSITGEITGDDILGNIFANFCIGK